LNKVISSYGRPNASTLIAGSLSQPQESLLFYDHGIHKSAPKNAPPQKSPATVLPVALDELPYSTCDVPTDLNIVAHQDDDLLFMNPDILNDIKIGHCVRTVYVTAGDGGGSKFYWLSREQGSEAAYSAMLGTQDLWVQRIVELNNHEYITVANPKGNSKISLIFMHLPDGNLNGQGFPANHSESLAQLDSGKLSVMHAVDGQSTYSSSDLVNSITSIMHFYQPTEIRTQANYISKQYPDHSDHMAVGRFVKKSYAQYEEQQYDNQLTIPISFYIGYPVHGFAQNVTGKDLQAKEDAFFAYAKYDSGVCDSVNLCQEVPTYNAYLTREYKNPT
jgi:LmbE family N-acetylglucosaminyl deacetylase